MTIIVPTMIVPNQDTGGAWWRSWSGLPRSNPLQMQQPWRAIITTTGSSQLSHFDDIVTLSGAAAAGAKDDYVSSRCGRRSSSPLLSEQLMITTIAAAAAVGAFLIITFRSRHLTGGCAPRWGTNIAGQSRIIIRMRYIANKLGVAINSTGTATPRDLI